MDSDEDADRLYAAAPEEFMALRAELAKAARSNGDPAGATRIERLRKPTVAAWIVNAYVLGDAGAVDRLTGLGDRLRAAQERLDATELRELTIERRRLVDELTRAAFGQAGKRNPAAGLRDEVSGTFDAAIAEPEIAGRLGRLARAEQWSGFGFLPTGTPQLTVVRGGKDGSARAAAKAPAPKKAEPRKSAAERRREQKAVADAQRAFDEAAAAYDDADERQRELTHRIKQLTRRLAKLQDELDEARDELDTAKQDVTAAKTRRRDARSALDRAERTARD